MKPIQLAWQTSVVLLFLILGYSFNATAQTVEYVTLSASNNVPVSFPVQANQIISLVGYDWGDGDGGSTIVGNLANGNQINLSPLGQYCYSYGNSSISFGGSAQIQHIVTGLTNIMITGLSGSASPVYWATLQITTPANANVVSNYVPADAIVIPSSATGNVQIILESSSDLVNWTAANPGTYGASSATNRFFRVRAVHN